MKNIPTHRQRGLSLTGLIFVLIALALIALVAMKVVPSVTEFLGIKKAIAAAKASGTNPAEIRGNFDKQAETGYITEISGKDLDIVRNGEEFDVSFAYQKKINLVGPVSLLIEYAGSTATGKAPAKKID